MPRKKRHSGLPEEVLAVSAQLSEPGTLFEIPQSENREIRGAPQRRNVRAVLSVFPSVGKRATNDGIPEGQQEMRVLIP